MSMANFTPAVRQEGWWCNEFSVITRNAMKPPAASARAVN